MRRRPTEDARERNEIRRFHARLLRRYRAASGCGPSEPTPGVRESMIALWADHGYSLSEVALMFGLSRQRAHQLTGIRAGDCGAHGSQYRCWDDQRNRFVPMDGSVAAHRQAERVHHNRRVRAQRKEANKRRRVDAVRQLAAELGRAPTMCEVAERLGLTGEAAVLSPWTMRGRRRLMSYEQAARTLWSEAGQEYAGHRYHALTGYRPHGGWRKLTAATVAEIRARYARHNITQAALCSEYGVGLTTIGRVLNGTYSGSQPEQARAA